MYAWVGSRSIRAPYEAETARDHPTPKQPAKPCHRTRSVKFGDHPRYCVDPHRENVWRCTPAARWGSGTGSVAPAPDRAERENRVTFLRLTHPQDPTVPCLENPRVGGSIPPQATKYGNPATSTVAGFFIKICGISSVGRAIPCQGIGREFEPLIPLQMHKRLQKPVLVMGFCVSGVLPLKKAAA
jgi:hypothetical protein